MQAVDYGVCGELTETTGKALRKSHESLAHLLLDITQYQRAEGSLAPFPTFNDLC
jgi:hypothetical protein